MNHDQFSLPFLDTISLGGGFGLYDRSPTPKPTPTREDAGLFETPAPDPTASLPTQNRTLAITAHDYRQAGDRRLAEGWKARAEDNLAAIRLMTTIESEARYARPDEQERLARFTGFGASDLADRIFRRAGDAFAPAWEDVGAELEGLVSHDDLANLKRATYEETICATASKDAPWFVVPADNKWFSRLVVAAAIVEAVELLDLEYPKVTQDQKKELAAARAELIAEK